MGLVGFFLFVAIGIGIMFLLYLLFSELVRRQTGEHVHGMIGEVVASKFRRRRHKKP
jgi:hypothetical protein